MNPKTIKLVVISSLIILSLMGLFLYSRIQYTFSVATIGHDQDQDSVDDVIDVLQGARNDLAVTKAYDPNYYSAGYPPEGRGACTDVIWRSLQNAGYNLKSLVDADIQANPDDYDLDEKSIDPNIDFRRVVNLQVFFEKYAEELSTELGLFDVATLETWQGGDIVIFDKSRVTTGMHIAIVSDKRNWLGVPYLIHNYNDGTTEDNLLLFWPARIVGHYRINPL